MGLRSWLFIDLVMIGLSFSCSQVPKREVASIAVKSSNSMSEMGEYGNFVMLDSRIFQDVSTRVYGNCHSESAPDWMDKLSEILKVINQTPGNFSKFHVLELKRADDSEVSLSTKSSGVTILTFTYRKIQKSKQVDSRLDLEGMDCGDLLSGGKVTTTKFEWPEPEAVMEVLNKAEVRNALPAWRFDRAFLKFLYDNEVYPVLESTTLESIDGSGWIVQKVLNKWGNELRSSEGKGLPGFEKWKVLLTNRSSFANKIKVIYFIESVKESAYGLATKSLVKNFEKRGKNTFDPIYFFLQIRNQSRSEVIPNLKDFDACLEKKHSEVQSILLEKKGTSVYRMDANEFMSPGFKCGTPSSDNLGTP